MASEFDRIARMRSQFAPPPGPAIGIGDDCALLPATTSPLAWTVDTQVEGVHFERRWLPFDAVAERSIEAALSDLAAVGATLDASRGSVCGVLWALTVPTDVDDGAFDQLVAGCKRAVERAGGFVLGGNLAGGPCLTLTTTAVGRVDGRFATRAGAAVGDGIYVTGTVGAAALGLHALRAGREDDGDFRAFADRWRRPRARLDVGRAVARIASAAIDVSDGLAQDLGHIARASACRIVIDVNLVPLAPGHVRAAARLGLDPVSLALAGGEDYQIAFAAPTLAPDVLRSLDATRIGDILPGSGVWSRDATGLTRPQDVGYDHFADRK